ncbi:hypothetical protein ACHAWF_016720 [Thalassiosira exigua]
MAACRAASSFRRGTGGGRGGATGRRLVGGGGGGCYLANGDDARKTARGIPRPVKVDPRLHRKTYWNANKMIDQTDDAGGEEIDEGQTAEAREEQVVEDQSADSDGDEVEVDQNSDGQREDDDEGQMACAGGEEVDKSQTAGSEGEDGNESQTADAGGNEVDEGMSDPGVEGGNESQTADAGENVDEGMADPGVEEAGVDQASDAGGEEVDVDQTSDAGEEDDDEGQTAGAAGKDVDEGMASGGEKAGVGQTADSGGEQIDGGQADDPGGEEVDERSKDSWRGVPSTGKRRKATVRAAHIYLEHKRAGKDIGIARSCDLAASASFRPAPTSVRRLLPELMTPDEIRAKEKVEVGMDKRAAATRLAAQIYFERNGDFPDEGGVVVSLASCCRLAEEELGVRPAESSVRRWVRKACEEDGIEPKKGAQAAEIAAATKRAVEIYRESNPHVLYPQPAKNRALASRKLVGVAFGVQPRDTNVRKLVRKASEEDGILHSNLKKARLDPSRRWECDVCGEAVFDDYDECVAHEDECFAISGVERFLVARGVAGGGQPQSSSGRAAERKKQLAPSVKKAASAKKAARSSPIYVEGACKEFVPPRSKSNAERKSCVCGWGDICCSLKTFFDVQGHALGGEITCIYWSESCNFQNFWRGAAAFLNLPISKRRALERQWEDWKDKDLPDAKKKGPRLKIAKHHFPLEIVEAGTPWIAPITGDQLDSLGLFSRYQDSVLKYDAELGDGQSKRALKQYRGAPLYINAPLATLEEVTSLAARIQKGEDTGDTGDGDSDEKHTELQQQSLPAGAAPSKKRAHTACSVEGCTKWVVYEGMCLKHGPKFKTCAVHSEMVKLCSREGCTNRAKKGEACIVHSASWNDFFYQFMLFRTLKGPGVNPSREGIPVSDGNPFTQRRLKMWMTHQNAQREMFRRGMTCEITDEQIKVLDGVDFPWKMSWEDRYNELVVFNDIHGHCNVPRSHGDLGSWVLAQRVAYTKHRQGQVTATLTAERIEKLERIGFPGRIKENREMHWNSLFERLKQFQIDNGHTKVLSKDDKQLFTWAARQRTEHRKMLKGLSSTLSDERAEKLNSIGFVWDPRRKDSENDAFDLGRVAVPSVGHAEAGWDE